MNKLLIIILSSLTVFSCSKNTEKNSDTLVDSTKNGIYIENTRAKNLPIEFGTVEMREMKNSIILNGTVDVPPDQTFSVNYPLQGVVSSISHAVLPGRLLKKGEVLAQIQSMELLQIQQDYLSEKIKGEFLAQELERQKNLLANDATAKRKYQEIENQFRLNQLNTKALSEKLKVVGISTSQLHQGNISAYYALRSPSTAYVKEVKVSNGKNFAAGEMLFELVSTQHVHAELKVFGNDMNLVNIGQKVEFTDPKGQTQTGKVYLIDRTVDPENKSLNLHIHLDNGSFEQTLKPGQYISGRLTTSNSIVASVKESALLTSSEGTFIFTKNNEKNGVRFDKIAVKTGRSANGYVEIISPNIEGEIVTKGVSFVENSSTEE
jgi:cobalt-zinc-cadmium efflux system membrane fusion protein